MIFGTAFGLNVQCGSLLVAAHTPNWNGCGVGAKVRAWSGLKPSWPVSTTVKPQPDPGCPPSDVFGTRDVMNREIAFGADADRAHLVAACVDITLAKALDLAVLHNILSARSHQNRACSI